MIRTDTGVIALVPDRWADVVMPRHQVLKRLASHFPVVWIEPARTWQDYLLPSGPRFLAADVWTSPSPGLEVLSPGWRHPLVHRPRWLRAATLESRLVCAKKRLVAKGMRKIVLYLWRAEFAEALGCVRHHMSCYHVDDEYSFSDWEAPNSPQEVHLLQSVDQVIVHSSALMRKKGGLNPHTALIPNGVDFRGFSERQSEPADIAGIPHPRIGYAGVIKRQLDLALLVRLAESRPKFSFVLVGPVLNVAGKEQDIARLQRLPNVHFLGSKPAESLSAYVQHFDVCLMCYEVNDYTNYIYPLKLNEYLAAGRPTVSSPIEAIKNFSYVVSVARTDAEWLAAIEAALTDDANAPTAVDLRQSLASQNDWDALVTRIAGLFRDALARSDRGLALSAQRVHSP